MDIELTDETIRDTISTSQIFQIRQQILAYKHIIKNQPIPKDIEKNLVQLTKEQWEIEKERLVSRARKYYKEKIEKKPDFINYLHDEPYKHVESNFERLLNTINVENEDNQGISSLKSSNFEKYGAILSSYENIMSQKEFLTEEATKKIEVKINMLKNLDFYNDLKREIIERVKKEEELPFKLFERIHLNLEFYKREKPSKKKSEQKFVEKFESQIKNEQEIRKRQRHVEFVSALFSHQQEFAEFHRRKFRTCKKRTNQVKNYLDNIERREQELRDRQAKERVKALRERDFEMYIQLALKTKNTRIIELLNQTDSFLKQIGAKILVQKGEGKDINVDKELTTANDGHFDLNSLKDSNKIYYNLTHTTKEEVTIQPNLLEGGCLKSYQLAGLQWLVSLYNNKLNGVLADEMGLGKTIQTISLFCYLMEYIVVDEGHRMKNSRSKFAQTLGQKYTSDHRLLLTGTPLQNNLAELWSLLNFLLPKVFSSCDDFEKWFSLPLKKISIETEAEAQLTEEEKLLIINRLHQVLRPFLLRRVKKEVESEIPNKIEHVLKIELSSWQKLVYTQIKENAVLSRDSSTGKIAKKALMNLMMQLRKICNHPYLFLHPEEYEKVNDMIFRCSGKFELLDRILPKLVRSGHRVLMFCQMTNLMNVMQLYFEWRGFRFLRLDGNTKADERTERMAKFNERNSQFDIFLLSTRAGGLGLNLQTADTVILFDSDWNPQMDLQAQDRAHRIGQKSEVKVLRLITNSWIEEEILSKAAFKMNLDEIFIQAGLYNQRSTDVERRERLQDLLKKKSVYEELDDEIPNDEQINEMLARNEDELALYDNMDKERYEIERTVYPRFKEPIKGDDTKFFNYRLVGEDELPEWIVAKPNEDEANVEYGRGNRARKQISYADDADEKQWMEMMEEKIEDEDGEEGEADNFSENQEQEDDDEKEETFNPNYQYKSKSKKKKKVGRPKKKNSSVMEEEIEKPVVEKKKRGRKRKVLPVQEPEQIKKEENDGRAVEEKKVESSEEDETRRETRKKEEEGLLEDEKGKLEVEVREKVEEEEENEEIQDVTRKKLKIN